MTGLGALAGLAHLIERAPRHDLPSNELAPPGLPPLHRCGEPAVIRADRKEADDHDAEGDTDEETDDEGIHISRVLSRMWRRLVTSPHKQPACQLPSGLASPLRNRGGWDAPAVVDAQEVDLFHPVHPARRERP